MNSLISSPVAPPDPAGDQVVADGWFPPVSIAAVREKLVLGTAITNTRLRFSIEGGMLTALRQLAAWRTDRALAGAGTLAATTSEQLFGRNHAEALWERAVAFYAGADIALAARDISATDAGLKRAEEKDAQGEEWLRQAHAAIADLLSIGSRPRPRHIARLI